MVQTHTRKSTQLIKQGLWEYIDKISLLVDSWVYFTGDKVLILFFSDKSSNFVTLVFHLHEWMHKDGHRCMAASLRQSSLHPQDRCSPGISITAFSKFLLSETNHNVNLWLIYTHFCLHINTWKHFTLKSDTRQLCTLLTKHLSSCQATMVPVSFPFLRPWYIPDSQENRGKLATWGLFPNSNGELGDLFPEDSQDQGIQHQVFFLSFIFWGVCQNPRQKKTINPSSVVLASGTFGKKCFP